MRAFRDRKSGSPLMALQSFFRSAAAIAIVTVVTLAGLEIALRVADFRELREGNSERSLSYQYDAELGWMPIPGSRSEVANARTIHVSHNSLGLRDEEFVPDERPTIMFLGDSFVWGLDAEANERFSELLKSRLPGYKILAAGVSGFGTDQEYLLLKKLWPKVKPAIVVLIFCTDNDRGDNSTNIRYEGYHKPYFETDADGSLMLRGQPVPKSRLQAIKEDWWVHHSWLVRLANAVYLKLSYPKVEVPDPTERLVDMMKEFVEGKGSKFLVGTETTDHSLARHLDARHIPFVAFDGADFYPGAGIGGHWTPDGHKLVAEKLVGLLAANHVIGN
jgi:hypothetical protein